MATPWLWLKKLGKVTRVFEVGYEKKDNNSFSSRFGRLKKDEENSWYFKVESCSGILRVNDLSREEAVEAAKNLDRFFMTLGYRRTTSRGAAFIDPSKFEEVLDEI